MTSKVYFELYRMIKLKPHTIASHIKRMILLVVMAVSFAPFSRAQMASGEIDIFMGVDFNYRDITFNNRVFDLLINLTPGVKWRLPHRWEISAGVLVPVFNQYGARYGTVRFNNLAVSKQAGLFGFWRLKGTAGVFGAERYGLDLKNMFIVNKWLAVKAEIGLTGFLHMGRHWEMSSPLRLSGLLGPEFYIHKYNTQLSLVGMRYAYGDYGVVAEAMRNFRHVSVGVYGSYNQIIKENVGFKIIAMLPPYKRSRHRVNIRPASNFRLTYSSKSSTYANRMYTTDPEENEREGWFDRDMLPWGANLMSSDFQVKDRNSKDKGKEDRK